MNLAKLTKSFVLGLIFFLSWIGICLGEELVVSILDVGQADSILIQTAGKKVLIDAGEDKELVTQILERKGIHDLDLVVATHPHADHIGGMLSVLDHMNIKMFIDNGFPHTTQQYNKLMEAAEAKVTNGMRYMSARQGNRLNLGKEAYFEVLWPTEEGLKDTRSDINANSVILRLTHGDVCFLFMADAEADTEKAVLPLVDKCQVLKVAHHGTPHSSIPEFINKVKPEVALISVGLANKHGHPGQSTLDILNQIGAKTYRTDWMGEITVISDGKNVRVTTEKNLSKADLPCLDINRATQSDFESLKGIGKTTSDRIMETRASHPGAFASVDEFLAALPKDTSHRLGKMRDYLSIDCSAHRAGVTAAPTAVAAPVVVADPAVVAPVQAPVAVVAPSNANGLININTADAATIAKMPGMTAKRAAAAVEYRDQNGPYKTCKDLKKVKGIGDKTVEKVLPSCTVE